MNKDELNFLRDRLAFWTGISCLIDRKIIRNCPNIEKEFFRTKEYFKFKTLKADEVEAAKYIKELMKISLKKA